MPESKIKSPATVIIPARWTSSRFPGKVLTNVQGKPMIAWIIGVCRASKAVDQVIVATDDRRIFKAARAAGAEAEMTSPRLKSGSDRVAAVAKHLSTHFVINVQGDEVFDDPRLLSRLVDALRRDRHIAVSTPARPITPKEAVDPHLVKVVCDKRGNALYFSRSVIPYDRKSGEKITYLGHIGIYVFRRQALLSFAARRKTQLELAENLEQLRLLEHGEKIRVLSTKGITVGVDTPADLRTLTTYLKRNRLHLRGDV